LSRITFCSRNHYLFEGPLPPGKFLPALVEVDGEKARAIYLKKPFRDPPDFAAKGVIYSLAELKEGAEIVLEHRRPGQDVDP
jgi:hypothetical protein